MRIEPVFPEAWWILTGLGVVLLLTWTLPLSRWRKTGGSGLGKGERGPTTRVRDPVCGMELPLEDVIARGEYRGATYYFCTETCRRAFEGNPAEYAGNAGGG